VIVIEPEFPLAVVPELIETAPLQPDKLVPVPIKIAPLLLAVVEPDEPDPI
jgi:hypothetical protein